MVTGDFAFPWRDGRLCARALQVHRPADGADVPDHDANVPARAALHPLFSHFITLGLYELATSLVIVYLTFTLPFCILMLRSYF